MICAATSVVVVDGAGETANVSLAFQAGRQTDLQPRSTHPDKLSKSVLRIAGFLLLSRYSNITPAA
jgi:hypothetical protein